MKLLTFIQYGTYKLGVKINEGVVDVSRALAAIPAKNVWVPQTVHEVIEGGAPAVEALKSYVDQVLAAAGTSQYYVLDEANLTMGPCVIHPNKMICVGLNYRKHAEETNSRIPEYPVLFNKFNNTLNSHRNFVVLPKVSEKVDYEAELCVVIGKKAKTVSRENALDYVFGYCIANDLSARDLQMRTSQWLLGKSCDGFSPLGPYLVTADEVGDPNVLDIRCIVNGEVRQHSNTSDMIFYVDEIVSYISRHMTLVPGDIILTGTPEGVALGYPEGRQPYLKHGDVVTVEIEKLGSLTNRMVNE